MLACALASGGAALAAFKGALEPAWETFIVRVLPAPWFRFVWVPWGLGAVSWAVVRGRGKGRAPSGGLVPSGDTPEAIVAALRTLLTTSDAFVQDATSLLDRVLACAVQARASDIHLSPEQQGLVLAFRLDGQLQRVAVLTTAVGQPLQNRVKVLSGLSIEGRQGALDGRFRRRLACGDVDVRVSVVPQQEGERVVLRVLEDSEGLPRLDALGFPSETLSVLLRLLSQRQGVLFVTGPVGSGKSTTLYCALREIHERAGGALSLMTLEDPVERRLGFLAQSQVDETVGLTFAQGLRSLLRQDPNVLMVGEIRDEETARVALQAGQSGHLILTTLHAPSAIQIFPRLFEMGLPPARTVEATVGVLAQRLVRRLCSHCKGGPGEVSGPEAAALTARGLSLPEGSYYQQVGCERCDYTGFSGRIPIAEALEMTGEVRARVLDAARGHATFDDGGHGLLRAGVCVAARGDTTLREVLLVAGEHA